MAVKYERNGIGLDEVINESSTSQSAFIGNPIEKSIPEFKGGTLHVFSIPEKPNQFDWLSEEAQTREILTAVEFVEAPKDRVVNPAVPYVRITLPEMIYARSYRPIYC
jgi:hypothetical protein